MSLPVKKPRKGYFSCLYSNVCSLKNKREELLGLIEEKKPDIVGLTEVWMKEHYSIQGFHPVFRHDREDQKGGGVMLLIVSEQLDVTECQEMSGTGFEEAVWCVIHLSKVDKLLVGVWYFFLFKYTATHDQVTRSTPSREPNDALRPYVNTKKT